MGHGPLWPVPGTPCKGEHPQERDANAARPYLKAGPFMFECYSLSVLQDTSGQPCVRRGPPGCSQVHGHEALDYARAVIEGIPLDVLTPQFAHDPQACDRL